MRIRFNRVSGPVFQRAQLLESADPLYNPGCGWYHVYTFPAQPPDGPRPVEEEVWLDEACREEILALVLVDIGAFRTGELSPEALDHISRIMDFFRENHKQMILRFVYDRAGKGMINEPSSRQLVKKHMEQIGAIIRPYAAHILVIQGIFVGNWGEMHGSKFLDSDSLCDLLHTLYRATGEECFLAVRTPAQWRTAADNPKLPEELKTKLALFNDGLFGSPTDLGTYAESDSEHPSRGNRSRRQELEWQEQYMGNVPNGGEALAGSSLTGYLTAAADMRKMHLSYLNSIYQPEQLEYWKNEQAAGEDCWGKLNGYEYIGRHLGYRFVVRDAEMKKGRLRITVENCGFANLCEGADCFLISMENGEETFRLELKTDPRQWKSGQIVLLETELPLKDWKKDQHLFLALERQREGGNIRFANQGAGEMLKIGSILIASSPST